MPFGSQKIYFLAFGDFFFEKNTMARVGKIKSLNCYNYGCVDDRVAIFGSKVWFSGSANLMVSVTLISYSSTEISTISIILQIFLTGSRSQQVYEV